MIVNKDEDFGRDVPGWTGQVLNSIGENIQNKCSIGRIFRAPLKNLHSSKNRSQNSPAVQKVRLGDRLNAKRLLLSRTDSFPDIAQTLQRSSAGHPPDFRRTKKLARSRGKASTAKISSSLGYCGPSLMDSRSCLYHTLATYDV